VGEKITLSKLRHTLNMGIDFSIRLARPGVGGNGLRNESGIYYTTIVTSTTLPLPSINSVHLYGTRKVPE
jgi:hypothetical protein